MYCQIISEHLDENHVTTRLTVVTLHCIKFCAFFSGTPIATATIIILYTYPESKTHPRSIFVITLRTWTDFNNSFTLAFEDELQKME